jgi:hypothetical protein
MAPCGFCICSVPVLPPTPGHRKFRVSRQVSSSPPIIQTIFTEKIDAVLTLTECLAETTSERIDTLWLLVSERSVHHGGEGRQSREAHIMADRRQRKGRHSGAWTRQSPQGPSPSDPPSSKRAPPSQSIQISNPSVD